MISLNNSIQTPPVNSAPAMKPAAAQEKQAVQVQPQKESNLLSAAYQGIIINKNN